MPYRPAQNFPRPGRSLSHVASGLFLLLILMGAGALFGTLPEPAIPASGFTHSLGCPRSIVPIYTTDTLIWDAAITSDMPPGSIIIMNPGATRAGDDPSQSKGGPGTQPNPDLQEYVRKAQERGYVVLGYIRTGEDGSNDGPRRNRAWTDQDIQDLKAWYDVDGIFYDEVFPKSEYYEYYTDLVAYGRETVPGLHLIHVGGRSSAQYAGLADIIGVFEGTADDFLTWSPDLDPDEHDPLRSAAAVMSVPDATHMRKVIAHAGMHNLGYVYATDAFGTSTENPWTTLPPYWDAQAMALLECST